MTVSPKSVRVPKTGPRQKLPVIGRVRGTRYPQPARNFMRTRPMRSIAPVPSLHEAPHRPNRGVSGQRRSFTSSAALCAVVPISGRPDSAADTAEEGSETADKFALLSTWAATRNQYS